MRRVPTLHTGARGSRRTEADSVPILQNSEPAFASNVTRDVEWKWRKERKREAGDIRNGVYECLDFGDMLDWIYLTTSLTIFT